MGERPVITELQQAALKELLESIAACDAEASEDAARRVVASRVDLAYALKHAIAGGAEIVGAKFDSGEYFLPHLVMCSDAMSRAGAVLEGAIPKDKLATKKVVVIGTVQADMHSVGKNIVAMMLKSGGFDVHDVGVDAKSSTFVNKAREVDADIIAVSSLLTTTMPYQRELVEDLKSMGLRDRFRVLVGGGPVTKEWAEKIGADGYGSDAVEALAVAKRLVGIGVDEC